MNAHISRGATLLQNPVSNPTEKRLFPALNEAERAAGPLEVSIASLVFMVIRDR
jgi:hypothetical protein